MEVFVVRLIERRHEEEDTNMIACPILGVYSELDQAIEDCDDYIATTGWHYEWPDWSCRELDSPEFVMMEAKHGGKIFADKSMTIIIERKTIK